MTEIDPIRCELSVDAAPEEAFQRFVALGRWWPSAYSWGEAEFQTAEIEPWPGGRWFERLKDGAEREWGEVRAYEEGRTLVLSFNISPERQPEPPERQSEVEITFAAAEGGGCRIRLEHRDLACHGAGAGRLRAGMASPQGWELILASFAREMRYPG